MTAINNQGIIGDIKKLCKYDPKENKVKAEVYKIPVDKKEIADGVFSIDVFKPEIKKDEKVILMIGATGTGKTTLINRMINYIFGVSYTDPFRFQLIDETEQFQMKTRTTDVHKYTIHYENFPYDLAIIDTPGINSTEGKNENKRTHEKLRCLFESGALETINAICIVERYNSVRLTEIQIYMFQTIAKLFGNDVRDVIYIMATCCDDVYGSTKTEQPQLLEFFDEQKIPYTDHYLFNNKDIYKKPVTDTGSIRSQVETAFWNSSTKSFSCFLEKLEATAPISLKLTKEILQRKHNITNAQLPNLVRVLKTNIHEIETLEQNRKIIEKMIKNPDKSDFAVEADEQKSEMKDITEPNIYFTWCKKCDHECHKPCSIHGGNLICKSSWWCSCMSWFFNRHLAVKCTVCPGRCSWRDHEQRPTFKPQETHTDERLKQLYVEDKEEKLEALNKNIEAKLALICKTLLEDLKEIKHCIDYINTHSLSSKPTTIQEYVDDVIDTEEQHEVDGYEQRIHCLKWLAQMKTEDVPAHVEEAKSFIQGMLKRES